LVEGVLEWLKRDQERQEVADMGIEVLKKLNVLELIKSSLALLFQRREQDSPLFPKGDFIS
jgi:hypothetical protein